MVRVNVYVDGLNLYNGALRGSAYRWLDLEKLSRALLQSNDHVQRIRYFTALIDGRSGRGSRRRQKAYIRALGSIACLTVHFGSFVTHAKSMPRTEGGEMVEVFRTDEKRSDVNLASHLLLDACVGDFDKALVISNDSDFAFPVHAVRERFDRVIGVSCPIARPGRRAARPLVRAASFTSHITRKHRKLLRNAQFPDPVIDPNGRPVHKPTTW